MCGGAGGACGRVQRDPACCTCASQILTRARVLNAHVVAMLEA